MTCNQVHDRATDFMERKLSVGSKLGFRAHRATCRACRAYLRQMRLTVLVLRGLGTEPVSEPVRASLLTMFRTAEVPPAAVAAPAAPRRASARALSFLDRLLGGSRSLVAVSVLLIASLGLAALVRAVPGAAALPLVAGVMCGGMEVAAGMLPLAIVAALAWRSRRPSSWAVYAVPAGAGALIGQASLHFTCPEQGMYGHLAFHVAGVLAAVAVGWSASLGQSLWTARPALRGGS